MPYSGQSGQYGNIPYAELRRKYEVTAMGDNAVAAVGDHMRGSLRDMSCSSTFFESDHKRDDNASESFLALRHTGHRTGETPDAPDLFLELTDRDPRGTALAPDFHKLRDQSWDRRDNYKFYSDSSHSVTEREKMPHVVQQQLRDQMENIRTRLKIFSTSRDGLSTNLGQKNRGDRPDAEGQRAMTGRDEMLAAVRAQAGAGDAIALGWEQTGDADLRVAQLGHVRAGQATADVSAAQREVAASARTAESTVQTMKTGAANLMRVVMDQGRHADVIATGADGKSREQTAGVSRFKADAHGARGETISTAQRAAAFGTLSRFIGQLNHQSGMQGQDIETQLQVVQFMDSAITASLASSEARFQAQDIVLSAKSGTSAVHGTKKLERFAAPLAGRNVGGDVRRSYLAEAAVAQLGTGRRDANAPRFARAGEAFKAASRESAQKRLRAPDVADELSRAVGYDGTQHHQAFNVADRHVRGLGSKFTRDRMNTERTLNAISSDS